MASKPPSRTPLAGGVLIMIGALGGSVIGLLAGEPTPGLLAGLALGAGGSLLIWLIDRRRS